MTGRRKGYIGPISVSAAQVDHQRAAAARSARIQEAAASAQAAAGAAQRRATRPKPAPKAPAPPKALPIAPAAAQPPAVKTRVVPESEYQLMLRAVNAVIKHF